MRKIRTNSEEIKIKMFEKNKIKLFDKVKELVFEAVVQRCSVKQVFLEVSQNSQENACARVSWHRCFPVNFANSLRVNSLTFFYRAPLVAASVVSFQSQIFIKKVSFGIV